MKFISKKILVFPKTLTPLNWLLQFKMRDVPKIFQIINYFEHNPKAGSLTLIIGQIFGLCHKADDVFTF
jgi:hypothetical protein